MSGTGVLQQMEKYADELLTIEQYLNQVYLLPYPTAHGKVANA